MWKKLFGLGNKSEIHQASSEHKEKETDHETAIEMTKEQRELQNIIDQHNEQANRFIEVIQKFVIEQKPEYQNDFLQEIQRTSFFLPTQDDPSQDNPSFMAMDIQGEQFAVGFTHSETLESMNFGQKYIVRVPAQILWPMILEAEKEISGFVINPGKEQVMFLYDQIIHLQDDFVRRAAFSSFVDLHNYQNERLHPDLIQQLVSKSEYQDLVVFLHTLNSLTEYPKEYVDFCHSFLEDVRLNGITPVGDVLKRLQPSVQ